MQWEFWLRNEQVYSLQDDWLWAEQSTFPAMHKNYDSNLIQFNFSELIGKGIFYFAFH